MKSVISRLGTKRLMMWVVVAVLCGAFWLTLGPRSLGGPASYIVVSGTSMQPKYHTGDLVVVRQQPTYHIGEIVAVSVDGSHVIHRLYAGNSRSGWMTKGINRTTPDTWVIPNKSIVGAAWLLWPGGARWIMWLGTTTGRAALAGLLALIVALGPSRRRRRLRAATTRSPRHLRAPDPAGVSAAASAPISPLLVNGAAVGLTLGLVALGLTIMEARLAGLNGLTLLPVLNVPVHPKTVGMVAVALLSLSVPLLVFLTGRHKWGWGLDPSTTSEAAPPEEEDGNDPTSAQTLTQERGPSSDAETAPQRVDEPETVTV